MAIFCLAAHEKKFLAKSLWVTFFLVVSATHNGVLILPNDVSLSPHP
jgi:hypothetical protein